MQQLQCTPVACIYTGSVCLSLVEEVITQFPTVHYSTPLPDLDWCMLLETNESGFDKDCSIF